jgi:cob(I)alamin adenosyltransferase
MKIYTKTGDNGDTGLFGGGRVGKEDSRVEAYGQVDELNSVLGMARAEGLGTLDPLVEAIQSQLFTIGALLATPRESQAAAHVAHVQESWITAMEKAIDSYDLELAPLTAFILPGGSKAASCLHLARTVCRRTERHVVPLFRHGVVEGAVIVYLNRLSDLLFAMARYANFKAGVKDVPWVAPKAS